RDVFLCRIIVCEDTQKDREDISGLLAQYQRTREDLKFTISYYSNAEELLIQADGLHADLYLLDAILPGMTALNEAVSPELRQTDFLQPHQSVLINMSFVAEMKREEFVLKNNMHVPISRLRRSEIRTRYLEFLRRQMEEDSH
ncbi:MAG: response regulator transcription factor, partial [Lachnospiraceae bacterium]|nr:response regulator transcription factor [Lachnospiraceae bacterium]